MDTWLLRKLLQHMSLRHRKPRRPWSRPSSNASSSSSSSSSNPPSRPGHLWTNTPADVLVSVFALLPPKDLAAVAQVCRWWNSVALDEALWEAQLASASGDDAWPSVVFFESRLCGGPQLLSRFPNDQHNLCFHKLYMARRKVLRSVVIDGGTGCCKYGWSSDNKPIKRLLTFLEFGNVENPMFSLLKAFYGTIFARLDTRPSSQPVIISTPICYTDDNENATLTKYNLLRVTHSVLFDLGVPSVCAVDQAVLALFTAQRTSGIVVNIGFSLTSIVPVLHGKVMRKIGVEVVNQGALNLTSHLSNLMRNSGMMFNDLKTVKYLKERLCYVAQDYEEELCKRTEESCIVPDVGSFTLGHERFKTSEILFRPRLIDLKVMSLHHAVGLCMQHCSEFPLENEADSGWYNTIVLTGGTACLPGLAERLKKELCKMAFDGPLDGLNVIPPAHGADSVWFGAKLLSNMSTFSKQWCITKKQYKVQGSRALAQGCSWY